MLLLILLLLYVGRTLTDKNFLPVPFAQNFPLKRVGTRGCPRIGGVRPLTTIYGGITILFLCSRRYRALADFENS